MHFRDAIEKSSPLNFTSRPQLSESDCRYRETAHHGSLPAPCAIAVDPIQGLVAVGNKSGVVKVIGREGVERLLRAEIAAPVSCLAFAPGLGIVCAGTDAPAIYIWDLTVEGGKRNWRCIPLRAFPTCLHCPSGAPFLYAGTSEVLNPEPPNPKPRKHSTSFARNV